MIYIYIYITLDHGSKRSPDPLGGYYNFTYVMQDGGTGNGHGRNRWDAAGRRQERSGREGSRRMVALYHGDLIVSHDDL